MARASRHIIWLTASIASLVGVYPALALDSHGYGVSAVVSAEEPESAYLAENDGAMTRMMNDMAVKPTGDVERDFVAMMTPHHQGAIDMAVAVLRYGHNEQLKRIAQEIIVDQQQEIAAMKLAIGDPLPPSTPAPTQIAPVTDSSPPITPTPMPMSPAMPGMASPSKM